MTSASPAQDVASPRAEQVPDGSMPRPRCNIAFHETPMTSRDNLRGRAGDNRQNETRHDNQPQAITRLTVAASAQQPHCLSRFEPALPGALQTTAGNDEPWGHECDQEDGHESLDFGVTDVADRGLKPQNISDSPGNAEYDHSLMNPVNTSSLARTESASKTLKAQDPTTAKTSENLESIARQVWNSWPITDPERDQTSREEVPHQPRSNSTSPLTELSLTSTEEPARAGSPDSSQNPTVRPREPSALRPMNSSFVRPQRESLKTLQDSEVDVSQTASKSCMSPAPMRDTTSHEESSRWRPANRSTVGSDGAGSSSVRETQGPLPEPACLYCRTKKRRCDRQKPRCE